MVHEMDIMYYWWIIERLGFNQKKEKDSPETDMKQILNLAFKH